MAKPFHLKVITPDKDFFDGQTEELIVRTTQGDVGILAGHTKYAASLPSGAMKIRMPNGTLRVAAVSSGMITVLPDVTTVIAAAVEWADEIDVAWAKRSEEDARARLKMHESGREFEIAQHKLERALNRLLVSDMR